MRTLNLVLAFILEIIAFLGFAAIGFLFPIDLVFQIIGGLVLLTVLIAFWGRYMSPKAPKKVGLGRYYVIKLVLYAVATLTLFQRIGQFEGLLFFAISLLNDSFLFNYNKRLF